MLIHVVCGVIEPVIMLHYKYMLNSLLCCSLEQLQLAALWRLGQVCCDQSRRV